MQNNVFIFKIWVPILVMFNSTLIYEKLGAC